MKVLSGFVVLSIVLVASFANAPVGAQEGGVPPWPLLFEGEALLDGVPIAAGRITLRIGDWESRAVNVRDGAFACKDGCLIAGPPSFDYIGEEVTFHLDDRYQADFSFAFPAQSTPARTFITLAFGDPAGLVPLVPLPTATAVAPDGTPVPTVGPTPTPPAPVGQPAHTGSPAEASGTRSSTLWVVLAGLGLVLLSGCAAVLAIRKRR